MKAKILVLALFAPALFGQVHAQEQDGGVCAVLGTVAENIMYGRQNGKVMSAAMQSIPKDNPFTAFTVQMVKDAYAKPQYRTDANKADAVIDFRTTVELACYTSNLGK